MSAEDRSAFQGEVRSYLLENPEVIVEALNLLEARQEMAKAEADMSLVADNADDIFDDGYSWVGGNPDGDITLVEFMDYRCGYCRKAVPEVAELLAQDGNIRFVVKEFPILGEASLISSRFAIATKQVAGDEAYGQVHDALMEFTGNPDEVTLSRLAKGLGLDAQAILDHMDSEDVTKEIQETRELARRLQITGTPTFVLQDEMIRGYVPAAHMQTLVDDKRG